MTSPTSVNHSLRFLGPLLLTLGLWGMLLLGLQAGSIGQVLNPGSPVAFLHGLGAILPLVAGSLGVLILLTKLSLDRSAGFLFVGPLGLATLYGLVGLASAFLSPDGTVALYWTGVYVSVPLVLWAIAWGNDALDSARRIVYLNWLVVTLAVAALFVVAILYLKLGTLILTPSLWLDCKLNSTWQGDSWHDLTSGALRPTGVGRYAAIAAIIALGGLWQGRWRYLWGAVLVAAGVLLLTSGARTSFIGIAVAAPLVVFLHGGKRAALAGLVVLALLVPVVWGTGIHRDFLSRCLRVSFIGAAEAAAPAPPAPPKAAAQLPVRLEVPPGDWVLERPTGPEETAAQPAPRVNVPTGVWVLTEVPPREQLTPGADGQKQVSAANQVVSDQPSTPEQPSEQKPGSAANQVASDQPSTPGQPSEQRPGSPANQVASYGPSRIIVPSGALILKPVVSQGQVGPDAPVRVEVPPGVWVLQRLTTEQIVATEPPLAQQPAASGKIVTEASGEGTSSSKSFTLTGRTPVWAAGWRLFKESPLLGWGFHADRLILRTHMHNSFLHSLVQTGVVGAIPFMAALILGWVLLYKAIRNRARLPGVHRHLVIQTAGILTYLSVRGITESTGAFFGVDWLILAPLLLYLQVVNRYRSGSEPAP